MAGILNNKERVIDFILTNLGKEKLRDNNLEISYATFTDMHTFYDGNEFIEDASNRIMLENYSRIQDNISPEALQNGNILNFESGDFRLINDKILSKILSSAIDSNLIVNQFLSGAINNFKENYILSEKNDIFQNTKFELSNNNNDINFNLINLIPNSRNLTRYSLNKTSQELVSPIKDLRFSNLPNFLLRKPVDLSSEADFYFKENIDPLVENRNYQNERIKTVISEMVKKFGMESQIEVTNEKNSEYLIQFFIQNNEKLQKLIIHDLGFDPESGESYYEIGKFIKLEDGLESFVDSFILVLK